MWICLILSAIFASQCFCETTPLYYCADGNTQQHFNVNLFFGMWYAIEIIKHSDSSLIHSSLRNLTTCPIIYLSEDKSRDVDNSRNYELTYGPEYGHEGRRYPYDTRTTTHGRYRQMQPNYQNPGVRKPTYTDYTRLLMRWNYLRLFWDENGSSREYQLRYNITRPGLWISSGPQNGSQLIPKFSHFDGTIQVKKAVGDHMALTFCHSLPSRELFTVILSRVHSLDSFEINSVHRLLVSEGYDINVKERTCNGAFSINHSLGLTVVLWFIFYANWVGI